MIFFSKEILFDTLNASPMEFTVEGIVTDVSPVEKNMLTPMTVRPDVRVTWLREVQDRNAPIPNNNIIITLFDRKKDVNNGTRFL